MSEYGPAIFLSTWFLAIIAPILRPLFHITLGYWLESRHLKHQPVLAREKLQDEIISLQFRLEEANKRAFSRAAHWEALALEARLRTVKRVLNEATVIRIPPGYYLLRLAEFVYDPKTVTKILLPIIADIQHEHIEALAKDEKWKARWVRVRGYCGFWKAVGLQTIIGQVIARILGLWKVN